MAEGYEADNSYAPSFFPINKIVNFITWDNFLTLNMINTNGIKLPEKTLAASETRNKNIKNLFIRLSGEDLKKYSNKTIKHLAADYINFLSIKLNSLYIKYHDYNEIGNCLHAIFKDSTMEKLITIYYRIINPVKDGAVPDINKEYTRLFELIEQEYTSLYNLPIYYQNHS